MLFSSSFLSLPLPPLFRIDQTGRRRRRRRRRRKRRRKSVLWFSFLCLWATTPLAHLRHLFYCLAQAAKKKKKDEKDFFCVCDKFCAQRYLPVTITRVGNFFGKWRGAINQEGGGGGNIAPNFTVCEEIIHVEIDPFFFVCVCSEKVIKWCFNLTACATKVKENLKSLLLLLDSYNYLFFVYLFSDYLNSRCQSYNVDTNSRSGRRKLERDSIVNFFEKICLRGSQYSCY